MPSMPRPERALPIAWIAITISAILAMPASVLAATPEGTTGGAIIEPEVGILSRLLDVAGVLAGIAIALGVVIGLAYVVARIDGPVIRADSATTLPGPTRTRASTVWTWSFLIIAGIALVVGAITGRVMAFERSAGGLHFLNAAVLGLFLAVAVIGLGLTGLVAAKIRHGHIGRANGTVLAAAALLATGAFGGAATAAATGGVYHEPVALQASGETTLMLDASELPFAARNGGRADCQSNADGQTVVLITAFDLGELGPGTLRAMLSMPIAPSEPATAEFFVDGGDLPEGATAPSWTGRVLVTGMGADHASGRLAFDGLSQHVDEEMPAPATSWPTSISGELTWSCHPW
jgi:hypothetical protein